MAKVKKIMSLIVTYIFVITMTLSDLDCKVLATTLNDENLELKAISGQVVVKVKNLNDTSYKDIIEKYQGKEIESYDNYLLIELDDSEIKDFKEEIKLNQNVELVEDNAGGEKLTVSLEELVRKQDYISNTSSVDALGEVTDTTQYKTAAQGISSNTLKISVKAPNGDNVISGKLIITSGSGSDTMEIPIVEGITYIDKRSLVQGNNFSVFGKTSKDEYVLYGDIKIDNSTVEIKGTSLNKTKFNISIPNNKEFRLNFKILKKKSGIEYYDMDMAIEDYVGNSSINSFLEKYNNKNIYIDGSEFLIEAYCTDYNNSNKRMLAQVVNNKTTNINLDYNNVSQILLENHEGHKVDYIKLGSSWATLKVDNSDYISKNVFDNYNFQVVNNNSKDYERYNYVKKLSSPINTDSYAIKYGEPLRLVAETSDSLLFTQNMKITANVYLYDKYENLVDSNLINDKYINKIVGGKKKEQSKIYTNRGNGYYIVNNFLYECGKNVDVFYSLDFNGRIIESNTIKYTFDESKYKIIPAKDPLGQPLVSGGVGRYKIIDGYFYMSNDEINNSSRKYDIKGFNANGDRVIYEDYSLNKDTKEIMDSSLAGYTVNLDKNSFKNINTMKFILMEKSNSYYGSNTDSFEKDFDEIKPSFKYFVKADNYDLVIESNNSDTIYLTSSKIGKGNIVSNIANNAKVNVKIKSSKYPVDELYYSLKSNSYGLNSLDVNKNIFLAPNTFYINRASIHKEYDNGTESEEIKIKDSFISNEGKRIMIGSERTYNVKLNDLLYLNENNTLIKSDSFNDEYGNKLSGAINYTIRYKGNNYDSGEINNINSLPSSIKEGVYTVELTINKDSNNPIKITQNNIKVISRDKIIYQTSVNVASYKLYKGSKEVDASFNNSIGPVILQNPNIIDGEDYRYNYFEVSGYTQGRREVVEIEDNSETAYVKEGKLHVNSIYNDEVSWYKITNAKRVSVYGKQGLKVENILAEDSEVELRLLKGQAYTIEALIEDNSGIYLVSKNFIAEKTGYEYKLIDFDKSSLKKVTIESSAKGKLATHILTLSYVNGKKFELNEISDISKGLYLPSGSYEITMDLVNYALGISKYKKNIVVGSSNVIIPIGKNLSYEINSDKSEYNINEEVRGVINNFKDNDAIKSYLVDNNLSNIKIDLMHGDSVVTSFGNTIPKSLKGDCIIRISGVSDSLGKIVSKNIPIVINNNEDILVGDINLDGYVDLFDLIYISKDIDKEKGVDSSFDPRVNLDNSNNKIDIADLAKAAMNYSK
ncbi:hypothetical protein ACH36K_04800 [Clostridium sp. MB05]